jgi:hypothetical protein
VMTGVIFQEWGLTAMALVGFRGVERQGSG